MAQFIQDNIQFTANNLTLSKDGKRHSKFGVVENEDFSEEVLADNGGVLPFVNAVEIDWNGAQLGE